MSPVFIMSGSRANAAAIQRRTNASQQPLPSKPQQQQQQQQQQYNQRSSLKPQQQQQQVQKPSVRPKISVSDAIALTTLRLGRVENFINGLPPLDQIGNASLASGPEFSEGLRVVDEALFNNMVSRIDKLEKEKEKTDDLQKQSNQKWQASLNILSKQLDSFKKEITELWKQVNSEKEQKKEEMEEKKEMEEKGEMEERGEKKEFHDESINKEIVLEIDEKK